MSEPSIVNRYYVSGADGEPIEALADGTYRPAFPVERTALVPLATPFLNDAGFIENIHVDPTPHVSHLFSHRGAVRANHWHRSDAHWSYVVRGKVLYFERAVGSTELPKPQVFGAREKFFTPSGVEHAMLFAEDTDLITMARNVRLHEQHEADVVRVDFITPAIAAEYVR